MSVATRFASFYAAYFACLGTTSIYIALYLQAIGFSAAQIATLLSLQLVLRIVIPNFWGHLADKTGGRLPLIRLSMLASWVATLGLFFTNAVLPVTLLFLFINAMWSCVMPLFEAIVMRHVEGDTGRYALIRLWGSVGFIVAVSLTGPLLDVLSVLALLPVVAGLLAGAIVVAWMIIETTIPANTMPEEALNSGVSKASSTAAPVPAPASAPASALWQTAKNPAIIALLVSCILMMASQGANNVFYSIHMVSHGYSKTTVGLLWSLGVFAEVVVFWRLTQIKSFISIRNLYRLSFCVTVIRFLIVAWFPEVLELQIFAQTLHAFTFGTWHAAAIAMLHKAFPETLATRGQALYSSLAYGAGGAGGNALAGVLWEPLGAGWTFTAMSALALLGGLIAYKAWPEDP